MPVYEIGDMWTEFGKPNTLFVITTNSTVLPTGALVMGRGIAKAARDRISGIDLAFGKLIQLQRYPDEYGFLILDIHGKRIGAFQVKTQYSDPASPRLVRNAAEKLKRWALENPTITINLNFPAIGNGRLPEDVVRPLIDDLPSNVHVWKTSAPSVTP